MIEHLISLKDKDISQGVFNVGSSFTYKTISIASIVADRCYSLYGYLPEVKIMSPFSDDSNKFLFSTQKLLSTGFQLKDENFIEIDATLNFCRQNIHLID